MDKAVNRLVSIYTDGSNEFVQPSTMEKEWSSLHDWHRADVCSANSDSGHLTERTENRIWILFPILISFIIVVNR